MRVAFFGTPEFALPILKAVSDSGHPIVAVVTRPDKPKGRGRKEKSPPPVALAAREMSIPLLQPVHPKDDSLFSALKELSPEAIVVAAYGNIIPDRILELPPKGAWNVHPSLLPRWRGPAPVHRAIWAGDGETGVSIMRVTSKLDSGPVAIQEKVKIGPRETRGQLEATLSNLGAKLLVRAISDLEAGTLKATPQDEERMVYAAVFSEAERSVDFSRTASETDRLIRALEPSPGTYFLLRRERVKICAAVPCPHSNPGAPGTLLERIPGGAWRVACSEGSLWIESVQPGGKQPMSMDALLAGRRLSLGDSLNQA